MNTHRARSGITNGICHHALALAGLSEIGLFGLPLVVSGRRVARYVRCYDPHIYREYGVARIALGLIFLLGYRKPEARYAIRRAAAAYYAANALASLTDLFRRRVAPIEWAALGLSGALSAALWSGTSD